MKFTFGLVTTVVSLALCGVVHAAPAPLDITYAGLSAELTGRHFGEDVAVEDLVSRAKKSSGANKAAISSGILKAQKAQGDRQVKVQTKKNANARKQGAAAQTVGAFRKQANKGVASKEQIEAQAKKIGTVAKSRIATQSRIDHKLQKTQKWAAKKKTPEQKQVTKSAAAARRQERKLTGAPSPANKAKLAKNVKPTKQMKQNVKQRFEAARKKFDQTEGMPGRKQTLTVGRHTTTGRAARQAVFNSYLHNKTPVGNVAAGKQQPKRFLNSRYSATHGNANLAGTKPLPRRGQSYREYPVINNSPTGWTGKGPVGAMRTITYKKGGKRYAEFIGHNTEAGGSAEDHYVATRT